MSPNQLVSEKQANQQAGSSMKTLILSSACQCEWTIVST